MTQNTCTCSEGSCIAYRYCRALEAHGLQIPLSKECYFTSSAGDVHLHDVVAARIEALSSSSLIRVLVEAAQAELESFNRRDTIDSVSSLAKCYDAKTEARMNLWKAMIHAGREGRPFTDVELAYYEDRIEIASSALRREVDARNRRIAICAQSSHDRKLMDEFDLLFDSDMVNDINRLVGNIMNSRPTLLVGDKGIAKTQVAKFVMSLYENDPIIVSVKGDMMSDELVGKLKHDKELGTFVFEEGVLLKAMREGLPVLLDEMNFGDQSIIARLQDVLLKKPGDTVFVQESGETICVAPGFAVIATANEASTRYRHREILDPAIRDRFDIIMRTYPDLDIDPLMEVSGKLMRLALASAANRWGFPSKHIDLPTLVAFVRLAHSTEYLYAIPGRNATIDFSNGQARTAITEESEPLMTDCITPRAVAKTVRNCAQGNLPGESLDIPLIDRLLKSLDQANSSSNFDLASQVASLMDIALTAAESKRDAAPVKSTERDAAPYDDLPESIVAAILGSETS